jgi:hypothetical protein
MYKMLIWAEALVLVLLDTIHHLTQAVGQVIHQQIQVDLQEQIEEELEDLNNNNNKQYGI